jgi:tetratricopeptide (TPR) repeat protein
MSQAPTSPEAHPAASGGFTATEVARSLGLSPAQIHSWVRAGFLMPRRGARHEYRFTFQDLVVLRAARDLAAQLPARRVKRALRRLREQLPQGRGLAGVRLSVEGDRIVVRDDGRAWHPDTGQSLLAFDAVTPPPPAATVAPLLPRRRDSAASAPDPLAGAGRVPSAEDWFELGLELEDSDSKQARDAYRRALELEPGHFDARVNLGRLLHEAGELAAAEANYRLALRTRPGDATAAFNLGVALEDLRRPNDALRAYEQAIQSDPAYADAHYNLAQLYERLHRPHHALRHLQTYRALIEQGGA